MPRSLQMENPDLETPQGRDFFTLPSQYKPSFSRQETAKVFFGRSTSWLITHMTLGHLALNGEKIQIPQEGPQGHYKFRLYDVERSAHALFSQGIIDISEFESTLLLVKIIATKYRLI